MHNNMHEHEDRFLPPPQKKSQDLGCLSTNLKHHHPQFGYHNHIGLVEAGFSFPPGCCTRKKKQRRGQRFGPFLGWGETNQVQCQLLLPFPLALYLSYSKKKQGVPLDFCSSPPLIDLGWGGVAGFLSISHLLSRLWQSKTSLVKGSHCDARILPTVIGFCDNLEQNSPHNLFQNKKRWFIFPRNNQETVCIVSECLAGESEKILTPFSFPLFCCTVKVINGGN
uniref:Uncharacterized protein n=1 Tax=Micrurus spixii TaxID=129469 RepID=A0A2D4MD07_9SAUR